MSSNYRKIWEEFNNEMIPDGYHIHHIDGNHKNNNPLNLKCLHPDDHYALHLAQGDIVAKNGKFIQGASKAGKLGGLKNKGKKRTIEQNNAQSARALKHFIDNIHHCTGRSLSKEHREAISIGTSGEKNPMFGRNHTEESKLKSSKTKKALNLIGENSPLHGFKHSDESIQNMSEAKLGEKNPMYGRNHTEESLNKMRGKKWYNDGTKSILVLPDTQPENFIEGRHINKNEK